MVEKKSVASLANTSFIVLFLLCCHCEERGDEAIQSVLRASGLLRFARNDDQKSQDVGSAAAEAVAYFARRYAGYHFVKYAALWRAAMPMPSPAQNGRLGT